MHENSCFFHLPYRISLFITVQIFLTVLAHAQPISDLALRYTGTYIPDVKINHMLMPESFYRHELSGSMGLGPATLGLSYHYVRHTGKTEQGGIVLHASYDVFLDHSLRIHSYARWVPMGTNEALPTYISDSDLNFNLVWFDPIGFPFARNKLLFPSAYGGLKLNRFGRAQVVGGAGSWWNQFGAYVTAYAAINGLTDPMIPTDHPDFYRRWSYLKNAGINTSISYDFQNIRLNVRRNFAIQNAGNDLTFEIVYRHFLKELHM